MKKKAVYVNVTKSGSRAGRVTLERHGVGHFKRMAKLSNKSQADRSPEFFREMQKKSVAKRKANRYDRRGKQESASGT